jgi:hypothetical protein
MKRLTQVLVRLVDLKLEAICLMLKLRVRRSVQLRTQHLNILLLENII